MDEAEQIEEISQAYEKGRQAYQAFSWVTEKTEMEILDIGDIIQYKGMDFYVKKVEIRVLGYEIRHRYLFGLKEIFAIPEIVNEKLTGLSLPGSVTKVSGNQLQVRLDIDMLSSSDCWYSYATFYSLFYCMPEKGDRVYLYFPEALEVAAFVLNSVRVRQQKSSDVSNDRGQTDAVMQIAATQFMEGIAENMLSRQDSVLDITYYIDALADPADGKLVDLSVTFEDGTTDSLQELMGAQAGQPSGGATASGNGANYADGIDNFRDGSKIVNNLGDTAKAGSNAADVGKAVKNAADGLKAADQAKYLDDGLDMAAGGDSKYIYWGKDVSPNLEVKVNVVDDAGNVVDTYSNAAKNIEGAGKVELNDPIKVKTNKGIEVEFTNPAGNTIKYVEHNPKNIPHAIESAQNSSNAGKAIEGKVGNFVQQKTEVSGFGQEVLNSSGGKVTDLDVVTNSQIIEVKKSAAALKIDQIDRLVDATNPQFFNFDNKEVIIYIEESIEGITNPHTLDKIQYIQEKGIKIVNSLDELEGVLK